ncbi:hypothetical protein Trydic_g8176 [Trypoxylus dichotomus]
MRGVICHELLKPSKTINSQRYRLQLMRLKQAIREKRLERHDRYEKLILQHDTCWATCLDIPRRDEMGGPIPPTIFTRHCPFRLSFVPYHAVGTY